VRSGEISKEGMVICSERSNHILRPKKIKEIKGQHLVVVAVAVVVATSNKQFKPICGTTETASSF
jgi:hypothetical protein